MPSEIQSVVLDLIGRFPADLDALGRVRRSTHAWRRAHDRARGHPAVRDGLVTDALIGGRDIPGRSCRSASRSCDDPGGTRLVARERPATRRGRLCRGLGWDHFMGKGDLTVPVVECWTALSMAAAQTKRDHGRYPSCSTS